MSQPTPTRTPDSSSDFDSGRDPPRPPVSTEPPRVPDHEMIRIIGRGSYGTVWLSRNIMGTHRAVKVVYRDVFDHDRPYEREFEGIQRFEPVSRTHDCHLDILHIGRSESAGYFYYVMELADDASTLLDAPDKLALPQTEENTPKHSFAQSSPEPTPRSGPLPSPAPARNRGEGVEAEGELGTPDRYQPRTLRRELHRRGPLPVAECVELGLALTTALVHLHRHGLVHRDIKPSNIVYVNGQPKLADIGLISHVDATLSLVGTLGFAPPEGPGTPQGDIYSLGKVLYEAVTGRDRQEFPELPTRITGTEEQQAELLELNEVLLKACEGDRRHRYQTAAEMHEDLLALRSGKSLVRLRTVEKRLTFARRAGAVTGILLLLAAGSYGYQARQTQIVERLAERNLELAQESRELLMRLHVDQANRLVEEGQR